MSHRLFPRKRGTQYVVRDAAGVTRSVGRTKHDAIAPYLGRVTRTVVIGHGVMQPLKGRALWQYLRVRGWSCVCEPIETVVNPNPMEWTEP